MGVTYTTNSAATYEPLIAYTVPSNTSSVTLGSGGQGTIPSTYTDLILVIAMTTSDASDQSGKLRFNNDTGTNYSTTHISSDGGSVTSGRNSNADACTLAYQRNSNGIIFNIVHIMNYSNTTTYKTAFARITNAPTFMQQNVNLWRNTNAINRIDITFGSTIASGSTFTLYGIKGA